MPAMPRPTGPVGLYDPRYEHDACGVAFVARLSGEPTHETVQRAIVALENLEHRGAAGADPNTGDGAGILLQMPDELMRGVVGDALPKRGAYGVCVCFLPQDENRRTELEALLEKAVTDEGQKVVGWRDIPVDKDYVGITANFYAPYIKHLIVAAQGELAQDHDAFERKLYVIRRVAELAAGPDLVIPSFSARTVVYKGMLTAPQLLGYYPDLQDPRTKSALALVHSRFSTNTFPSWELAHPYRMIAHNGEINTLRGNVNWMRARESQLASELFGDDLPKILPIVRPGGSDSATFDNVLELLTLAGRSLPHAVMMMIPEAYEGREDMPDDLRGFYAFHSCLMEPWDGPASVAFTDGRVIGATLDRNGLRPGRWLETKDGWVVLGSETGVIDVPAENVLRKGRLQPGNIFLVDLGRGRIVEDGEVKREIASRRPYLEWFERGINHLADLTEREPLELEQPLRQLQFAFGYTQEDMKVLLAPTACKGEEPIGSMGNDLALAVLSDSHPPLFSYFKQLFAQVTNPPIDPIREAIVMSVSTGVGSERNLLDETPQHACQLAMKTPILRNHELENLRQVDSEVFKARTLDITWSVEDGPDGMAAALDRICAEADAALAEGVNVLVLSDRATGPERVPMPSLLAVGGVHHHLVREGTRLQAGLVLESGEPREVHHFATLIGYGASAINPYLMFESLGELVAHGKVGGIDDVETAEKNVVKGIAKGLLKTISKMGISTVQSYNGAQIFEAVGLSSELIDRCFTGTASRIEGVGIDVLARESLDKHAKAFPMAHEEILPVGGVYAWRRDGEHHMWNPETIALLQHAVRHGGRQSYDEYSKLINDDAARRATLRGLLQFRELPEERVAAARRGRAGEGDRQALRDRRDVARLAVARGARDAGDRDEPPRRPLQHRRGRRGPGPLHARPERRLPPLGDQAGRLRPLRREHQLPRQLRRAADQDGAGRQARRGRPAARPQGRPLHRLDPLHHSRRGPDLAAPAPRHLLDRGPQAADLRPALLEPGRAREREAGVGGRGRDRRGRGRQGERRPRADLGVRRRHRRQRRCPRSSRPACRGRSASPRRSRRSCSTTCARASGCRPTARSRPAATSWWRRCWAPTRWASRPRR